MTEETRKIIDDDWKRRAQAEKEALADKYRAKPGDAGAAPTDHPGFVMLVQQIATQALFHLGLVQDGSGMERPVDFEHATATIQQLEALEAKTKGNLTSEEEAVLRDTLQDVRLAFVEVSRRSGAPQEPAPPPA